MFDDIFETHTADTRARFADDGLSREAFTGRELLAEAGLPARAIREILRDAADAGACGPVE